MLQLACGSGVVPSESTVNEVPEAPGPTLTSQDLSSVETPQSAADSLGTMTPTPTVAATTAPSVPLTPLTQPLRAWSISSAGAVYVLDATSRLYQLSPPDLSPLRQSEPLFPADDHQAPAFLLATADHLFVGSRGQHRTVVLNPDDFSQTAMLEQAGPIALDESKQTFFLIPEIDLANPMNGQFVAYDLANPDEQAQIFELACQGAEDMVIHPFTRRLYVRAAGRCSSPPHRQETFLIYDLDTLSQVAQTEPRLGQLTRPAVEPESNHFFAAFYAPSAVLSDNSLFLFDAQGQLRNARSALDGLPLLSPDGEWLYLLRERGVWIFKADDMVLQSIFWFDRPPPADIAISPTGEMLYLIGNAWLEVRSTLEIQDLGIPAISPFPDAWHQADAGSQSDPPTSPGALARLYRTGQSDTAFAQLGHYGGLLAYGEEMYRTQDDGQSWRLLSAMLDPSMLPLQSLSPSPDFATDQTLIHSNGAKIFRSTDSGDSWQPWTPALAFVSERDSNRELYLMTPEGENQQRVTQTPTVEENPAWSPAWTRLAFQSDINGNWDIFTMRLDCPLPLTSLTPGGDCEVRQLTTAPTDDLLPAWSPDSRSIAFVSLQDGNPEIYLMDHDGQNQRRLTFNPSGDWRPAWLPDSRQLVFTSDRSGNNDLYLLPLPETPSTSEPELTPLITDPADDRAPTIQGKMLYFLSDRDGFWRVYRQELHNQYAQTYPATETEQPEGHPSLFGDTFSTHLLLTSERDGASNIYRVIGPEYIPLTTNPTFDGQPTWGPVLWNSVEA